MKTSISTTKAARNLGDCLARIKHTGDSFILKKNGKSIATLGPVIGGKRVSLRQLLEAWRATPTDPSFADDLQTVNEADRPPKNPWD